MTPRSPHRPRPSRAFTLIELMVVLLIIVIVSAITFPFLGAMNRDIAATNGINTVQAATTAARAYAVRPRDTRVVDPSQGLTAEYSGVAALFTPDNLIRLIENDRAGLSLRSASRTATGTNPFIAAEYVYYDPTEYIDPAPIYPNNSSPMQLNGFVDIEGREPITLNPSTGVVGIVRVPNEPVYNNIYPVRLNIPLQADREVARIIPPPFAVWFSQAGSLIAGVPRFEVAAAGLPSEVEEAVIDLSRTRVVFYDADGDGLVEVDQAGYGEWPQPTNSDRRSLSGGSGYNPGEWDPASPDYDPTNFNTDSNRLELPFEIIEAVVGILIYDKSEFRNAGLSWPDNNGNFDEMSRWFVDNGTPMFFSPTSGIAFRQANEQ